MLKKLLAIIAGLADANDLGPPFIVGGVPRDIVFNSLHSLNDLDITTGDEGSGKLADLFANETGKKVKEFPDGHKQVRANGISFDFSSNFKYNDIEEICDSDNQLVQECFSRDFTINSLLIPLDFSRIIDLTDRGLDDAEDKKLVCPADAMLSFENSPNRIARVFYYAAKYDLIIDDQIIDALKERPELMKEMSVRYAGEKLNAALRMKPEIMDLLINLNVFKYFRPTKYMNSILIKNKRILETL